ncbi:hypothetical protein BC832DRAFT_104521 [Gaertneriomyces semiglobifer]|nr:hypothetical protein BC832DRAFT_104521 [Gaertneriomyces semiglobifer]
MKVRVELGHDGGGPLPILSALLRDGKEAFRTKLVRRIIEGWVDGLYLDRPSNLREHVEQAPRQSFEEISPLDRYRELRLRLQGPSPPGIARLSAGYKDCGGSAVCEHGRGNWYCKDCGGGGICEHDRLRLRCKDCGGSAVWERWSVILAVSALHHTSARVASSLCSVTNKLEDGQRLCSGCNPNSQRRSQWNERHSEVAGTPESRMRLWLWGF